MGHQIIRQPNGQFAIFSSHTDTIIFWNASEEDIISFYVDRATVKATHSTKWILERIVNGEPEEVYHQFALTWEEAISMDRSHDGTAHKDSSLLR
jgi:hypothetical protein